jgi:hypothetical protein
MSEYSNARYAPVGFRARDRKQLMTRSTLSSWEKSVSRVGPRPNADALSALGCAARQIKGALDR